MSARTRRVPNASLHNPAVKTSRKLSLRRLLAYAGASLGGLVLAVPIVIFVFGGAVLNHYGKGKAERAFAEAHPGFALRLGGLEYAAGANRLVAQSVTLIATNATIKAGRVSLTGVRWLQLLLRTAALADVLGQASLEATNLDVEFPQAQYGIRCARLRASVPGSELIAEGTELRPLAGDEAFFAAHLFQTPRFRVVLPECRVLGLVFGEMLQGGAYRAGSVHLSRPTLDTLINRDKAPEPFTRSPLMVHEALASMRRPLQVGSLRITNGHFSYCERLAAGAEPAVLTLGAVSASAEGIANRGDATAAIRIQGQGDLMNAGIVKVRMTIPINPPNLSIHFSGSLGAMDLTRLNPFLETAEHTRIKSGRAEEAGFDINVIAGGARGRVDAIYRDLEIAVLDKETGNEKGLGNRVASLFAKVFKVRSANTPEGSGARKEGVVNYTKSPDDEFLEFVWFALRTGVMDLISH